MGFLDSLGAVDSATGGLFSSTVKSQVERILPAGALPPNAKASIAKPSIQGQPSNAPEATFAINGWRAWASKPVVWVIGGVVVVALVWKLIAKRGK